MAEYVIVLATPTAQLSLSQQKKVALILNLGVLEPPLANASAFYLSLKYFMQPSYQRSRVLWL